MSSGPWLPVASPQPAVVEALRRRLGTRDDPLSAYGPTSALSEDLLLFGYRNAIVEGDELHGHRNALVEGEDLA